MLYRRRVIGAPSKTASHTSQILTKTLINIILLRKCIILQCMKLRIIIKKYVEICSFLSRNFFGRHVLTSFLAPLTQAKEPEYKTKERGRPKKRSKQASRKVSSRSIYDNVLIFHFVSSYSKNCLPPRTNYNHHHEEAPPPCFVVSTLYNL